VQIVDKGATTPYQEVDSGVQGGGFSRVRCFLRANESAFFSVLVCLVFGVGAFTPAGRAQTTSTIEGGINDRRGGGAGAEVRLPATRLVLTRQPDRRSGNYQLGQFRRETTSDGLALRVRHQGF